MADLPLPQISQIREKKMVSTAGNFSSRPSPDGSGSQKFEDMEVAVLSLEDSQERFVFRPIFFCKTKMNDIKETTFK